MTSAFWGRRLPLVAQVWNKSWASVTVECLHLHSFKNKISLFKLVHVHNEMATSLYSHTSSSTVIMVTGFHFCPLFCSDCESFQVRQEGRSRLCVLHCVTPRGVDLLRGRRLGALLLQLQDGEAAQNPDGKSVRCREINHSNVERVLKARLGVCSVTLWWCVSSSAFLAHRFTIKTSSASHITRSTTWSPPTARTVSCGYGNPELSQCPHMDGPGRPAHGYKANHIFFQGSAAIWNMLHLIV